MNVHSHYENLKVSRDAPMEVIKAAYKALSMLWHPDRNESPSAPRIMSTINIAYETLSDPVKRREHDEWLAAEELLWTLNHPAIVPPRDDPAKAPQKPRGRAFEIDEQLFAKAVPHKRQKLPLHTRVSIGVCAFFGFAGAVSAVQIIFHG